MLTSIEQYWSAFLGCDAEFLNQSNIVLVPRLLDHDYEGYYFFRRGDGLVISVLSKQPALIFHKLETAIGDAKPADVFSRDFLESKFAGEYERLVGPAAVHYLEPSSFRAASGPEVRKLSGKSRADAEALRHLFGECSIEEWEHSGIQFDHDPIFGSFEDGRLAAACSYEMWTAKIAHIGVAASPKHRGAGHGTAVVSAVAARCLGENLVPQYRTLAANEPAMAIGRRLGFVEYARTLSMTLHDPD